MPRGVTRGQYEPRPPDDIFLRVMNTNIRLNQKEVRVLSKQEHWEREQRLAKLDPAQLTKDEKHERGRALKAIRMRIRLAEDIHFRNKEILKTREWRTKNPQKVKEISKTWTTKTKDKRSYLKKQLGYQEKNRVNAAFYKKAHPDKYRDTLRQWRRDNPNYSKDRYKENLNIRLLAICRSRVATILKNAQLSKKMKSHEYLGCTNDELCKYIKSHLSDSMTMEKIIQGEIEIHHRIPPTRVMRDNPSNFFASLRYDNLVPMWKDENRKRLNSIWPDMALEAMRWGIRLKPHEIEQAIRAGVLPLKNT